MTTLAALEERIRKVLGRERVMSLEWAPLAEVPRTVPAAWRPALAGDREAHELLAPLWEPVAHLLPRTTAALLERVHRVGLVRTERHPDALVYVFQHKYWFAWRGLPPARGRLELGTASKDELALWSRVHDGFTLLHSSRAGAFPSADWAPLDGFRGARRFAAGVVVARESESLLVDPQAGPPAAVAATKWKIVRPYPSLLEGLDDCLWTGISSYLERPSGEPSGPRPLIDDLFAAFYDAPGDEARRLVLADALAGEGDVRGELILLQCGLSSGTASRGARAREKEMLRDHRHELLGALQPWVTACHFERGFVATCSAHIASDSAGEPAWATVRELKMTGGRPEDLIDFVRRTPLRSLRSLWIPYDDIDVFAAVLERALPLERLGVQLSRSTELRSGLRALAKADRGLADLRHLEVDVWHVRESPRVLDFLVGTRLWRRLEELTLTLGPPHLGHWVQVLRTDGESLKRLRIVEPGSLGWSLALSRDPDGELSLDARWLGRAPWLPLEQLAYALQGVAPSGIAGFRIEPSRALARDPANERRVQKELARLRPRAVEVPWGT